MLTTLSTVKSRLAILATDTTHDALLTNAIKSVSARFDKECDRTFARAENATYEFDGAATEVSPPLYPIESVTKFELKTSESEGWLQQATVSYLTVSVKYHRGVCTYRGCPARLMYRPPQPLSSEDTCILIHE